MDTETTPAAGEQPFSIVLENGEVLRGKYLGYEPAGLIFDTPAGRRKVPLALIPADLHECFPNDPTVAVSKLNEKVETLVEETTQKVGELNQWRRQCTKQLDELIPELERRIEELTAERDALRLENEALKRERGDA